MRSILECITLDGAGEVLEKAADKVKSGQSIEQKFVTQAALTLGVTFDPKWLQRPQ